MFSTVLTIATAIRCCSNERRCPSGVSRPMCSCTENIRHPSGLSHYSTKEKHISQVKLQCLKSKFSIKIQFVTIELSDRAHLIITASLSCRLLACNHSQAMFKRHTSQNGCCGRHDRRIYRDTTDQLRLEVLWENGKHLKLCIKLTKPGLYTCHIVIRCHFVYILYTNIVKV